MEQHVNSVSRSCYGQLRQIGHIRRYLTSDATKSLVNSLVTSRLDYCNVLLNGMPNTVMKKMQNVQNMTARIVTSQNFSLKPHNSRAERTSLAACAVQSTIQNTNYHI